MHAYPHVYTTTTQGTNDTILQLSSKGLLSLEVTPPVQFDGPDGYWSPETFFSASIGTCFILTFKVVSRAMKLSWENINVDVDAFLDKGPQGLSFNRVVISVHLKTGDITDEAPYLKALEKAEKSCLITNSLKSEIELRLQLDRSAT